MPRDLELEVTLEDLDTDVALPKLGDWLAQLSLNFARVSTNVTKYFATDMPPMRQHFI